MRRNIIGLLILLLGIISCQERNPGHFIDVAGVYFNNMTSLMSVTDSTDLTFVYEAEDYLEVPVKVQLLGRPADHDRPFEMTVTSDNAMQGTDYQLPAQAVIPAGASESRYNPLTKRLLE